MEYSQLFRTPMRFDLIKDEDDGEIHPRDWLLGIYLGTKVRSSPTTYFVLVGGKWPILKI